MLGAYFYIHPKIDTHGFHLAGIRFGASDADNAIDLAIEEILHNRYPYHAKTFLGNPITPMPGALALAFPFYLAGDSFVQNIFWLAVFFGGLAAYHRNIFMTAVLACFMFFLSPNVLYHVLQGNDYIANAIYILTFSALLLESTRRKASFWQSALWAVLLGIGLSSRLNFMLILPLVFFALIKTSSRNTACALTAITLACFSALTLPFFIYDPAGFSPLHTSNKLSFSGAFSWAPFVLPLLGGILSIALALKRESYKLPSFMQDVFMVQAVLMVGGLLLASIRTGGVNLEYPHFGLLFMFFGVFAFGPASLIESGALAVGQKTDADATQNTPHEAHRLPHDTTGEAPGRPS
jgi:hypothetical protein